MPLTKLDDTCALIVIDLQKGIAGMPLAHPAKDVIERSAQLARAFRHRGWPVVLVNVAGRAPGRTETGFAGHQFAPDWADLVPELDPQPNDLRITKQRWGAFLGTSLDAELRKRGVTQVVITGIATSKGVESTARSAYDLGYNVTLIVDAMTDRDAEDHRHHVERMFPWIAETGATEDLLQMLR